MNQTHYMLDTNTASFIIKGEPVQVRERLIKEPLANICVSAITAAELLLGAAKKPEAKKLPLLIKEFLLMVDVLDWDADAANTYAELRAACEKAGKSLGCMDMLIAAHARSAGCTLVTNDKAFLHIERHLSVDDWT